MQIRRFKYRYGVYLFHATSSFGAAAFIIYSIGLPSPQAGPLYWILSLVGVALLMLSLFLLRHYFRLRGRERFISIDDQRVSLPDLGDSLNLISLDFSRIREVYFAEGRYGTPDNLIIKYDTCGHAYIWKDGLKADEFEEICHSFKQRLGLTRIETRSA